VTNGDLIFSYLNSNFLKKHNKPYWYLIKQKLHQNQLTLHTVITRKLSIPYFSVRSGADKITKGREECIKQNTTTNQSKEKAQRPN
jgi:hypothetical protein